MRTRHHHLAVATAVAAALTTFGCTTAAPVNGNQTTAAGRYGLTQSRSCDQCDHAAFIRELHLTAAQGHALRTAMKDAIRASNPMLALLRELTTPHTGVAAMSAGIETLLQLDAAQDAHTLAQIKALLTPPQRMKLAEAMRDFPTTHAAALTTLAERATAEATRRMHLTPAQQELFAACARDYERLWRSRQGAYMAAIADHLEGGGQDELHAKLTSLAGEFSKESTAAFLASLSPDQGRSLVVTIQRFQHRMVRAATRWTVAI